MHSENAILLTVKVKVSLLYAMQAQREHRSKDLLSFLTSALDGGGRSTPRPGRLLPLGKSTNFKLVIKLQMLSTKTRVGNCPYGQGKTDDWKFWNSDCLIPEFYLSSGCVYRVSQEEWTKLRESVPYVELYRYNPKHPYPKLNGYGDNGQRSLKLWQLLHTYWLPNTY